jgi:hypothetical protein
MGGRKQKGGPFPIRPFFESLIPGAIRHIH